MRTRRDTLACVAVLAASGMWLYWPVMIKLVHDWATDDNYSHGFVVAPVAAYLTWERRGRLAQAAVAPMPVGLAVVIASLATLAAGVLGSELFLTRISLLGTAAGSVLFLRGRQHLRILAFPLAFLLLMVPLPAIIFNRIAFPLQQFASQCAELGLSAVGVPVYREGNVIVLATTTLQVAEACSGIRSLVSLLTLGILYGYFADDRLSLQLVVTASTIPIAILANGLRVAGTGVAAHYYGAKAADGFFHTFSGVVVFLVALSLILVVHRLLLLGSSLATAKPWRAVR